MADDPLPGMLEAHDAGMDVNDYLAWLGEGISHVEALKLHAAQARPSELTSAVEAGIDHDVAVALLMHGYDCLDVNWPLASAAGITCEEMCEALASNRLDSIYYAWCRIDGGATHAEIMEMAEAGGYDNAYSDFRSAGASHTEAMEQSVIANRIEARTMYFSLIEEGCTPEEILEAGEPNWEGVYDLEDYSELRKTGLDHEESLARLERY